MKNTEFTRQLAREADQCIVSLNVPPDARDRLRIKQNSSLFL